MKPKTLLLLIVSVIVAVVTVNVMRHIAFILFRLSLELVVAAVLFLLLLYIFKEKA